MKSNKLFGIFLVVAILLTGFFIRIYRLDQLLGFYYDQGRDAIVIRDLLLGKKAFLIGPTTGVEGIFLGPIYYLTLAPWYWVGGGDPVAPAIYIVTTSVIAITIMAKIALEMYGSKAAMIFLFLGSFSYWTIVSSRWLANPAQLMLASALAIFGLWKVFLGKKRYWIVVSLAVSAGLQFEAAGATFFLPAILLLVIFVRKIIPSLKIGVVSLAIFVLSLTPQVLFDFRHDHILFKSFFRFLISERSFEFSIIFSQAKERLEFLISALLNKVFPNPTIWTGILLFFLVLSIIKYRRLLKLQGTKLLLIWLLAPVVGLTIYRGNHGYVWDYYLTGVYLVFLLLVAVFLSAWSKTMIGKISIPLFLIIFVWENVSHFINFTSGVDGPTHITLGNEKQAVNWVLTDAKSRPETFNVDVYVPPVIPYSYDYLFWWLGRSTGVSSSEIRSNTLYTLYEVDPPHPERLSAWLTRQNQIGVVEEIASFGGITVERRSRLLIK